MLPLWLPFSYRRYYEQSILFFAQGLLACNAVLWAGPGIDVLLTGIRTRSEGDFKPLPTAALALAVFIAFHFMFRMIVRRNIHFVISKTEPRIPFWEMMPLHTWLTLLFFMLLGITLKHTGIAPPFFTAFFYCGLGVALIEAGIKYLIEGIKFSPTKL